MVSSTTSRSDSWRVGVLFSRTGLMAVTETEHFFGAALAIQEINQAGGVLGREIEVIAYDPESDPAIYRRLADRLLTEDGVSVIFGCSSSAERKAVLPAAAHRAESKAFLEARGRLFGRSMEAHTRPCVTRTPAK